MNDSPDARLSRGKGNRIQKRRGELTPADLLAQTVRVGDCLNWTRRKSPQGYAIMGYRGHTSNVSRVMWLVAVGPIAPGLEIDHLCNNGACINLDHLEPVTHAENIRRRWERKTECIHGHDWTVPRNVRTTRSGVRRCAECERIRSRAIVKAGVLYLRLQREGKIAEETGDGR